MIKGKRHQALFYFGEIGHFHLGVTTELRIRDFMLNAYHADSKKPTMKRAFYSIFCPINRN